MKSFLCTNIKYDTDGQRVRLPKTLTVVLDEDLTENEWAGISEFEIEERLADAISDETGFCVDRFEFEEILSTSARLSPRAN